MAFSKREAPNCDWCKYKTNCLYNLLGTKEAKKAWREMRVANPFKSGETIFHEGMAPQGVYIVCSGRVKIYKSSRAGHQLITRIESPGDLVGHITLMAQDGPYTGTAEALEPSVVSLADEKSFFDFLNRFPEASRALLREVSRDVRRGENKARDIAFKPARARMADTLLRIKRPGKPPVIHGFKRRDLAEMAGLTIETTVRLIKDFESRGLVQKKEKDILILSESQLQTLAGSTAA
ncbi:MAG: Crp/Fnr family transcriptional regulator [Elusimicrobiota bacterium]